MKIRNGFVSNSSSSSFICDICQEDYSGYDVDYSECEICECENGHSMCWQHLTNENRKILNEFDELDWMKLSPEVAAGILWSIGQYTIKQDHHIQSKQQLMTMTIEQLDELRSKLGELEYYELLHDLPAELCPICGFDDLILSDIAAFLMFTNDLTQTDIKAVLKKEFGSYSKFAEKRKEMYNRVNR